MNPLEEKLKKFRREKAKEKLKQELKNKCKHLGWKFIELGETFLVKFFTFGMTDNGDHPVDIDIEEDEDNSSTEEVEGKPLDYLKYFSILLVWLSLYAFFIYIQFGAVYFCVTGLLFVYFNTRTGRRLRNEVSAYSVFNKNCEQIDGTFTAEQFDKQIRSGMMI